MIIGGLEKFSVLDYPGYLSAIVFTQGCNFRCQFCYNPMLVWPASVGKTEIYQKDLFSEKDLFVFLEKRINQLEAVVITGGEPTLHNDLPEFIDKIKKLGYLVKLDTNGSNPRMLEKIINNQQVDYLAMDLKAPPLKYDLITGIKNNWSNIKESINLLINFGSNHEFRTTLVPEFFEKDDVLKMGEEIKGAEKWFLQKFKSDVSLVNNELKDKKSFSSQEMEEIKTLAEKFVKFCQVR
jgi:pyruvate formate lyase activating enzyme